MVECYLWCRRVSSDARRGGKLSSQSIPSIKTFSFSTWIYLFRVKGHEKGKSSHHVPCKRQPLVTRSVLNARVKTHWGTERRDDIPIHGNLELGKKGSSSREMDAICKTSTDGAFGFGLRRAFGRTGRPVCRVPRFFLHSNPSSRPFPPRTSYATEISTEKKSSGQKMDATR